MKWPLRVFVLAAAALAIVAAPNGAWAGNQGGGQGGGGKGGSHHSGGQRSGAGGGLHTRFHGGFVGGSFWYSYYASPFYFYEPRPFYYYGGGPLLTATARPRTTTARITASLDTTRPPFTWRSLRTRRHSRRRAKFSARIAAPITRT